MIPLQIISFGDNFFHSVVHRQTEFQQLTNEFLEQRTKMEEYGDKLWSYFEKVLGLTELAETICENLSRVTPLGRPELDACRKLLKKLKAEGIIHLPPNKKESKIGK